MDVGRHRGATITRHRGCGSGKQYANRKRSDLVVWATRDVEALGAVELKTVATPLSDPAFQNDVIKKARRVGAPYCVQWNQRETAIYLTPEAPPTPEGVTETFS